MQLSNNNGRPIGHWLFGLVCAAIGNIASYTVDKVRSTGSWFKSSATENVLTPEQAEQVRQSFFTATFSIMGHVAKADGPITKSQINLAKSVMERMELPSERCASAIELFNRGKQSDFDLDRQVKRFRDGCASSTNLYRVFLETQIEIALADGYMTRKEEAVLLHLAKVLGFSTSAFRKLEMPVRVSRGLGDNHNSRYRPGSSRTKRQPGLNQHAKAILRDACSVLGVNQDDHKSTVKAAYRKLMNQYHPDKLESKGLPEEMLNLSKRKAQEIQKAYKQIKLVKRW